MPSFFELKYVAYNTNITTTMIKKIINPGNTLNRKRINFNINTTKAKTSKYNGKIAKIRTKLPKLGDSLNKRILPISKISPIMINTTAPTGDACQSDVNIFNSSLHKIRSY